MGSSDHWCSAGWMEEDPQPAVVPSVMKSRGFIRATPPYPQFWGFPSSPLTFSTVSHPL